MALIDKLTSWWGLQEASGTRVDEHGSNDLTDNNTVGQAAGHVDANAASFVTANSEYLSCASNSSLLWGGGDTDSFGFTGWVYFTSLSDQVVFGKDSDAAGGRDYVLELVSGDLKWTYLNSSGTPASVTSTASISTSTWYFFNVQIASFNALQKAGFIWVDDGAQEDTGVVGTVPNQSSTQFRLGARVYASFEWYMSGRLEQVACWNEWLDDDDRAELWNGGAGIEYADIAPGALVAGTASATAMTSTGATFACTTATDGAPNYTYQLQRGTDGVTFGTDVGSPQTVAGAPSNQADTGLTTGTQYYWRWHITDTGAGDVYSNTVTLVPRSAGQFYFDFTNGADGNNGTTTGTAWKTPVKLQAFLNFTFADDIASIQNAMAGNFRVVAAAGTSGHPVTINSFGTGGTITASNSYGFWLDECTYTTVDGLTITGSGVSSSGVTTSTESGVKATLAGAADRTNVNVTNCTISGFGVNGITYEVAAASSNRFVTPTLSGNTIFQCRLAGIWLYQAVWVTHVLRFTDPAISGNEIYECYGNGTGNSGYGMILGNCDGGLVEDNYVHECGEASAGAGGGPVGIMTAECDGVVVQFNEIDRQYTGEDYDGFGIDFDGGSINCIAQFNYIHDCDGAALVVFNIGGAFTVNDGNIIRFNVSQNNGRRTIVTPGLHNATWLALIAVSGGPTDTLVYNNTEYSENATGADTNAIKDQSTSGTLIRDNIIILSGSSRTVGVIAASTVLNPNRYYALSSAAISGTDGGTPFANFAALQGLGQEAGGSSGDPALQDIGNAGSGYPLGNFATLTEYDPTTSAIWDGGSNIQSYAGPDFHGNTMPTPVTGEYPLGAVGFAAAGARRRRVLMGAS